VEEGSITKDGATITFIVTDGGATLPVAFTGIVPDLFTEGQGMIATGVLQGGTFQANEILAKHDEEYMPKEVADALKEQGVYKPATQ
jgi:cytochrome c-type biogenesis protein CcmE